MSKQLIMLESSIVELLHCISFVAGIHLGTDYDRDCDAHRSQLATLMVREHSMLAVHLGMHSATEFRELAASNVEPACHAERLRAT